jgi:hypothetical protein
MPDTDPPIGTATNAGADCSPCASPPVDCTKDIITLKNEICSLQSIYAELLRKYGSLQSKLVSQAQYSSQFIEELERLRRIIAEMDTETGGCGAEDAENADSILVCDSGSQKVLKPGADCAEIIGKGGKWLAVPRGLTWHPLGSFQTLASTLATANYTGLNGYDDLIESLGDDSCGIWGVCSFQDFVTGLSSDASGTSVFSLNNVVCGTEAISGGGLDSMGGVAMFPMTSKQITTSLSNSYSGAGATHSSALLRLLGYFA